MIAQDVIDKIIDRAEYVNKGNPGAPPDGIRYVLVNGKIAVKDKAIKEGARYGRCIMG